MTFAETTNPTIARLEAVRIFKNKVRELKDQGKSEKEIADHFGMTVYEYRKQCHKFSDESMKTKKDYAIALNKAGYSNKEIASVLDCSESTVNNFLKSK